MPAWNIGDRLHGFYVERCAPLPHLNANYWKLTHEKTGATLYYTDRDDGQMMFTVAFRTLPEDDTGVFHIIEHSTLDGSEHFPLREPFVNLMKTSLAVTLNASTWPDKTDYYFVTTDEQDYMNMMTVYLDAVFHPLVLSDRRIFEKEAWHLEPDGQGGLACSGVVFNEMQGANSSPDRALYHQMCKQLFPDLYLRFDSGGDPAAIRALSYEQFCETYRRFYGVNNAIFFLSGRLSLDRELSEIDRVLTEHEPPAYEAPAVPPLQTPVVSPDGLCTYQISENESEEKNTRLCYACVLGADAPPEDALGMQILARYLAETVESPLSHAVLDADIGVDFEMAVEPLRQPVLLCTLSRSEPGHAEAFREIILSKLKELIREGLDHQRLTNLIDDHEAVLRRRAQEPRVCFSIQESLLNSHVWWGDARTPDGLVIRDRFAADPRYFEKLLETYMLNSQHWSLTRCVPSRTADADNRAAQEAWLTAESDRLHAEPGAYEALETHAKAFQDYLLTPDSPEAEASIPHLSPEDITLPPVCRDMDEGTIQVQGQTIPALSYPAETGSIAVGSLMFDLGGLDAEELFYAHCLADALTDLPTRFHSAEQLRDRILETHAILGCYGSASAVGITAADLRAYLTIEVNVPEEHLPLAVDILLEYMREVVFDRDILRRLFSNASSRRDQLIGNGHRTALFLAGSALTAIGAFSEAWSGVGAYRRFAALAEDFDAHADRFIAGLEAVREKLFLQMRPRSCFIGSEAAYAAWQRSLSGATFGTEEPRCLSLPLAERCDSALVIPGEVNYCAAVYSLPELPASVTAPMSVVTGYLNSVYCWDEIRAKGGAYGAFASIHPYGLVSVVSYRDPHIAETYDAIDRLPDWLLHHIPEKAELDSLIVSTLSSYLTPRSALGQGYAALNRWLSGKTAAAQQADIKDILHTDAADFIAFAAALRQLNTEGRVVRAAPGSRKAITESGLFDTEHIAEL